MRWTLNKKVFQPQIENNGIGLYVDGYTATFQRLSTVKNE